MNPKRKDEYKYQQKVFYLKKKVSAWVSCACASETLVNRTTILFTASLKNWYTIKIQNTVLRTKAWFSVRFTYSMSHNITNQGCKEWYQIKDIARSKVTVGVSGVDYRLCAARSLLIIPCHIKILTISIRRHKNVLCDCSSELALNGWW